MPTPTLHQLLITDTIRRIYTESQPRILTCLDKLTDPQIWHRPNPASNSIGNLVLHLSGNIRQWIIHTLGSAPDTRQRQSEFDAQGPIPRQQLITTLNNTLAEAKPVIQNLTEQQLLAPYTVQGFNETGTSILIHIVEHLSYHTGQIAYITKAITNNQLDFYDSHDLNHTN